MNINAFLNNKEIYNLCSTIVSEYSHYGRYAGNKIINVEDVPEHLLQKLAVLIMKEDAAYAFEAMSVENPSYDRCMLPSFFSFLDDSTDKDNVIEFCKSWRDGVLNYFQPTINKLLQEILSESLMFPEEDEDIEELITYQKESNPLTHRINK